MTDETESDLKQIIEDMKKEYFQYLDFQIGEYVEKRNFYTRSGDREMLKWCDGRLSAFKEAKLMFHSKFS